MTRLSPEAGESFLRSAGLDPIRDSAEWDRWQRELPGMFERGESLRIWAESYRRGHRRSAPPAASYDYEGALIAADRARTELPGVVGGASSAGLSREDGS